MAETDGIRINSRLAIPAAELTFRATRSGGPGGQHVNTSSTRIELVWDLASSVVLSERQRDRLMSKLASRLDGEGRLRIVAQEERSQLRNRGAAASRLAELVAEALIVPKKRKPTRPTKASKERRLEVKKRRGQIKRDRRQRGDD